MAGGGGGGLCRSTASARLNKSFKKASFWAWTLSAVAVTACFVLAFGGIAWRDAAGVAEGASWSWLVLAVIANLAILPLAACQWIRFLPRSKPVSFQRMMWITAVTSTISNGGPFLAGHAAGVGLLATQGRTGYSAAVSVKALDQVAERLAGRLPVA